MCNNEIIEKALLSTGRAGMHDLLAYMDMEGFYTSPCSSQYHLSYEGGLAEHSINVLKVADKLRLSICPNISVDSVIICSLLHDVGKMGQFGKPGYVPNMLKGRATKTNPNPEPHQSTEKPYKANNELLYVDHEVRSIAIISKFICLTEEEQQAILFHNGLYGAFKYQISGKETPLYMILHFADLWASRVIEMGEEDEQS